MRQHSAAVVKLGVMTVFVCGGLAGCSQPAGPMLYPAPELPDDTLVENVRLSTRMRNALKTGDLKTVGEIREASDAMLLSTQNLGKASVAYLRQSLGLRSTGGVRPDKLS